MTAGRGSQSNLHKSANEKLNVQEKVSFIEERSRKGCLDPIVQGGVWHCSEHSLSLRLSES